MARGLSRRGGRPRSGQPTPSIDRSARAVATILARGEPVYGINTGFGKLASVRIEAADLEKLQRNIVLSHAAGVGPPMPVAVARLMMALKLASLAQGASGVRRETVRLLEALLDKGLTPVVPCQGSVGASGDLAPLAHMSATLIGVGAFFVDGAAVPAERALAEAGLSPLVLGAKEGLALLNGTQFSTAYALAGAVRDRDAVRLGAGDRRARDRCGARLRCAVRSAHPRAAPPSPARSRRPHALRRLMEGSAIRVSHLVGDERVQDPYCLRCQPQVMGAVLDLLRHAATTLATEANGVTDNPLIFAETGEALSGGNFHAEPVAFAADIIALALCEIGSLAERRIAMLVDPALSGLPAFLTPQARAQLRIHDPAGHGGGARRREQAARPSGQRRFDPDLGQPGGPCLDGGARRAPPDGRWPTIAGAVIGIELLAAAQGCDFHHPLRSSPTLEAVRALVRRHVPHLDDDRHFQPDLARAADLVGRGALIDAIGADILPSLDRSPP